MIPNTAVPNRRRNFVAREIVTNFLTIARAFYVNQ
jgi:hypothetical protein